MIRLALSVMRILPWWGYALVAYGLAMLTLEAHEDYRNSQTEAAQALSSGPPPLTKVGVYDGQRGVGRLSEVHLIGTVRADLGIGRLEGSVPKSYFVMESPDRTGPLVAVMFVGSDDQNGLPELIRRIDDNGFLTMTGFRRTLDRADVAGQLRLQGISRDVHLVEGVAGDRAAVIRAKADRDLPFMIVLGVLALLAGLTAIWRYRRWQSRRSQRQRARQPVPTPTPQPTSTAAPSPAGPWSGQPAAVTATPPPHVRRARSPEVEEAITAQPPQFESVFPGGGSGFRFKTADEIIRETFGTVSRLSVSDRDP